MILLLIKCSVKMNVLATGCRGLQPAALCGTQVREELTLRALHLTILRATPRGRNPADIAHVEFAENDAMAGMRHRMRYKGIYEQTDATFHIVTLRPYE